jgi:hypothetical protein
MNIFITVFSYLLVFSLAFLLGFVFANAFRSNKNHSGVIKVIEEENKTLFSLELDEDPLMLKHKSEAIFKIETSD